MVNSPAYVKHTLWGTIGIYELYYGNNVDVKITLSVWGVPYVLTLSEKCETKLRKMSLN